MFKWLENLKKAIDEANAPRPVPKEPDGSFPDEPSAPLLTKEQCERLVSMINEFEARGLKLHPGVDRNVVANRIFEQYSEEWNDHPSLRHQAGMIPRGMMLDYLVSEDNDWYDSSTGESVWLVENADSFPEKLQGEYVQVLWNLAEITGGDIAIVGGIEGPFQKFIVDGKSHPLEFKITHVRDYLTPMFEMTKLLPAENTKRYRAFNDSPVTVVYAEPEKLKAICQFIGAAMIWPDDTRPFFETQAGSSQVVQKTWHYDLAGRDGVPLDMSALDDLRAISLDSAPRKSTANEPEILRVTEVCSHTYDSFHKRLWQIHDTILKKNLFVYDYSCEQFEP